MTDRKTLQARTEDAISDARGLFSNIYDENMPNLSGYWADVDEAKDRLVKGMKALDEASDRLQEFGFAFHDMMDARDEAVDEVARLETQVEAGSFLHLADRLEYELEGRILTDSPESVVAWVRAALAEVRRHDAPEDETEAAAIIYGATNMFAEVPA